MKLTIHCFAYGVKIEPSVINFPFRDTLLSISFHEKDKNGELTLQLSKKILPEEVSIEGEIRDEKGLFIEKRSRPYKELITEAAQLVEGLFSVFYLATPPKFDTERIVVNVIAESKEETEMIKSGKVTGGFGAVFSDPIKNSYNISDEVISAAPKAIDHLAALSFLAQAIRSQHQNDQEVAFFLYFRIIDGYFSDGASDVEKALISKAHKLIKYIKYEDEIKKATKAILASLKLKSKSEINFQGLISDIVLIRHKLTHFSQSNAESHHRVGMKFDLNIVNFYLRKSCVIVLLDILNSQ